MACSNCGSTTCSSGLCSSCSCTSSVPYYSQANTCVEDHCAKIYQAQYSFGICAQNSWNVPLCGQTAILSVPGVVGAVLGSFLWQAQYGYFEIISVDAQRGQIGIVNNCTEGNAAPGTQVPKCTCFTVTVPPIDNPSNADLFPYVAIDFTAPPVGDCVDITITSANGLGVGDTISIGTGFYLLDSFLSPTVIRICNEGDGILAGTPVIAQDAFGNYQYPITVTSNCCNDISADVDQVTSATATGNDHDVTTTPITLTFTNTSLSRSMQVMISYIAVTLCTQDVGTSTGGTIVYSIENSVNGAPYSAVTGFGQDIQNVNTLNFGVQIVGTSLHTVAPNTTMTVAAKAIVDGTSANPIWDISSAYLGMKAIKVLV